MPEEGAAAEAIEVEVAVAEEDVTQLVEEGSAGSRGVLSDSEEENHAVILAWRRLLLFYEQKTQKMINDRNIVISCGVCTFAYLKTLNLN